MPCIFGHLYVVVKLVAVQKLLYVPDYKPFVACSRYGVYDECYFLLVFVHARVVAMQVFQLAKVI